MMAKLFSLKQLTLTTVMVCSAHVLNAGARGTHRNDAAAGDGQLIKAQDCNQITADGECAEVSVDSNTFLSTLPAATEDLSAAVRALGPLKIPAQKTLLVVKGEVVSPAKIQANDVFCSLTTITLQTRISEIQSVEEPLKSSRSVDLPLKDARPQIGRVETGVELELARRKSLPESVLKQLPEEVVKGDYGSLSITSLAGKVRKGSNEREKVIIQCYKRDGTPSVSEIQKALSPLIQVDFYSLGDKAHSAK